MKDESNIRIIVGNNIKHLLKKYTSIDDLAEEEDHDISKIDFNIREN